MIAHAIFVSAAKLIENIKALERLSFQNCDFYEGKEFYRAVLHTNRLEFWSCETKNLEYDRILATNTDIRQLVVMQTAQKITLKLLAQNTGSALRELRMSD